MHFFENSRKFKYNYFSEFKKHAKIKVDEKKTLDLLQVIN